MLLQVGLGGRMNMIIKNNLTLYFYIWDRELDVKECAYLL